MGNTFRNKNLGHAKTKTKVRKLRKALRKAIQKLFLGKEYSEFFTQELQTRKTNALLSGYNHLTSVKMHSKAFK